MLKFSRDKIQIITPKDIKRSLVYYAQLKKNSRSGCAIYPLLSELLADMPPQLEKLTGNPIGFIFTADPLVIQREFGITKELLVLSLLTVHVLHVQNMA